MIRPESYVVYDFETTAKFPEIARPIQIAAKKVRAGKEPEFFVTLVKPKGWDFKAQIPLDPKIVELTGITPNAIELKGVEEKEALLAFIAFTEGLPLVGHNIVRYDNVILKRLCAEHWPGEIFEDLAPLDSCFDTAGIVKGRKLRMEQEADESPAAYAGRALDTKAYGVYYKLADSCLENGVDIEGLKAHTADADVEMTDRLFVKLTTV